MTASTIIELDPIGQLSPEDVFLVENVAETLSNSISVANLTAYLAANINSGISSVLSINDEIGHVQLTTSNVHEGTNRYYTTERVSDDVSRLLQQGTGIVLTYDDVGDTLVINAIGGSDTQWQSNSTPVVSSGYVNFTGAGVSVTDVGGVATIDIASASASSLSILAGSVLLDAATTAINFVGAGVTTTSSANTTTVTIPGSPQTITNFTAINNQTIFVLNYTVGTISVFISGVKLRENMYNASNGTSIILNYPVSTDTWVQTIATS
jgi:hypothetical protein